MRSATYTPGAWARTPLIDRDADRGTVFHGETLVGAVAAATEALGADVLVHSARRVKQGIGGLLGRERFEVTAARGDGLDDAYAGLLGAADAREVEIKPAAPVPAPRRAARTKKATAAAAPAAPPSPWSHDALRTVGVPGEVLAHMPADLQADDLAWTVALSGAIATAIPAPVTPSAEHPVVIDGFEGTGAVAILCAAVAGARPGRLVVGDRVVAATAAELAMAVRSCLVR